MPMDERGGSARGRWSNGRGGLLVAASIAVCGCGGLSTRHDSSTITSDAGTASGGGGERGPSEASGGATGGTTTGGVGGRGGERSFDPGAPTEVGALVPAAYANFGTTVALSGDTLAVGAPGPVGEAGGDQPTGSVVPIPAVFVYRHLGDEWEQEAILTGVGLPAPDPSDAGFATTLALEGDTLVVGAPRQVSLAATDASKGAGRVYVFARGGGDWPLVSVLEPARPHENQTFGSAIAISEGVIAVADASEDGYRGSVSLFEKLGASWSETAVIRSATPAASSSFGAGVALDRGTLAVAAPGLERAHVIEPGLAEWIVGPSEATLQGGFANHVAFQGDTLVVASYTESSNAVGVNGVPGAPYPSDGYFCVHSGAVYVYRRLGDAWEKEAFLKSADPQAEGLFGWDLALQGNTLLVAERQSEGPGAGYVEQGDVASGAASRGTVWVFQRSGTTWSLKGALKSPTGESEFAASVGALALSDRFVAVGAFADEPTLRDASELMLPYAGGVFVWPWR